MQLFLTGGTGFVGKPLLRELVDRGHQIRVLTRGRPSLPSGATAVTADLLDPTTYEPALGGCDQVLHLAAATGPASPREHDRVNLRGTRALLEACARQGHPPLVFVSSIAVNFPNRSRYHYALSKARAEEAVRNAGVRYVIVRPTQVFGPGSPVLDGLRKLARLPVTPLFDGGGARIQPVHVFDLVRHLVHTAETENFPDGIREVGGPETITMRQLLMKLRELEGRTAGAVMNLPLALLLPVLRGLEKVAPGRLPVTAGQLSSFRYDGLAGSTGPPDGVAAPLGLDAMLEDSA